MAQNSLLIDVLPFKPILKESKDRPGYLEATGPFQRANAKNHNGRVYSKDLLIREFKRYEEEFINNNNAFGELDHPDDAVVNLRNVSHVVKKIWWDGDTVMGTLQLLDTPSGNIARSIMEAGYTIGISSRGTGSVQQTSEGLAKVQNDFNIICLDLVSNPSTHGAFLTPRGLNEAKQTSLESINYPKVTSLIREILCSSDSCYCEI